LFYLKLVERIGASSYMMALFPAVAGIGSVVIGESEPTLYLVAGCLVSCIGASIAPGGKRFWGTAQRQIKNAS
jgi:hypothetical protein